MPKFDKTGPTGQGPTGRGMGSCVGASQQANLGGGFGRNRARCCGRGWGVSQNGNTTLSLEEEEKFLKQKLAAIQKIQKNNK